MGTNILLKEGIKPYLSVDDIVQKSLENYRVTYLEKGGTLEEIKSSLNIDDIKLFQLEAEGIIK